MKGRSGVMRISFLRWVGFLKAHHPLKGLMRIVPGCCALVRYCVTSDTISVSLSMFSTAFFEASMGQSKRFEILVCNCMEHSVTVRLAVRVSRKRMFQWSKNQFASYEKDIHLGACGTKEVGFIYDWVSIPCFVQGDVRQEPVSIWRGNRHDPGLYRIEAVLIDSNAKICDKLTLMQELAR